MRGSRFDNNTATGSVQKSFGASLRIFCEERYVTEEEALYHNLLRQLATSNRRVIKLSQSNVLAMHKS